MENDDIAQYLAALERDDCYRVDAILKESPHETTQRVFFVGANGAERGPYVRKLIHRDSGMGAAYERIFAAQQAGRRFKHIPYLFECYHDESNLVVVMEFVHGETLQDVVYRRDPSLKLAREVFPLICDAASELHESFDPPLIHRDLKPSNVMVGGESLALIDFGIARAYRQDAESDTVKFGTRAFAPPEQFGFGQTTVQSDVYALGMLLYYCLAEKIPTPSVRDSGFATASVPPQLRPVLARATALDASRRYATAAELKNAFLEAAGSVPELNAGGSGASDQRTDAATRQDPKQPAAKRRRPLPIAIGAIAAVLAIAAIVLFTSGTFNQQGLKDNNADSASKQTTASTTTGSTGNIQEATAQTASSSTASTDAAKAIDAQSSAPPRNGFNPDMNRFVEIGGVTFQIPSCFGEPIAMDDGMMRYYAEQGTASAMILTSNNEMDEPPSEEAKADSFKLLKDGYLSGFIKSNEELFKETTSLVDFTLAGYPARIATFNGTVKGLPLASKLVYFYNPDSNTIGSLTFGQTSNTQFDYSDDFAKTIASATPVR